MPRDVHEDIDQQQVTINGEEFWVTFCSCGQAFYDHGSQQAYDLWEEHEARFS